MISIKNVNKWYGDFQVLTDCSTEVKKGEVVVVCGPSGSGKSTLIKCVNALEPFQKGDIVVDGTSIADPKTNLPKLRSRVGMVFQHFELFPHLTITENLTIAQRKVLGRSEAEASKKGLALLDRVGLSAHAKKHPGQLSGGQQQRVAIARALVYEPRILLMDEPLGALDKKLREDLQDELRQLHRRLGITIVYVTHDQEEAMRLSQRIAIFSHGKIVGLGSGYDLYQNPPNAFVASFLGNSNFLRIKASSNGAGSFEGQPVAIRLTAGLAAEQQALIMVRPEKALALTAAQAAAQPLPAGWNEVRAKVAEVLFLGESQTCHVVTAGGTEMTVKALSAAGMPMQPGDSVNVRWAVADACIYTEWAESDLSKSAGAH